MAATTTTQVPSKGASFETGHEDMIHDAQLDYYGKRLATCSSDRCIRLFEVEESGSRLLCTLKGHDGPVWQLSWAHPKYGNIIASCSYDSKIFIWKEVDGTWLKIRDFAIHTASGCVPIAYDFNSIAWAPHELGLMLAAGSSDGKVSIITCKDDGTWDTTLFSAHPVGVNSVTWAPVSPSTSTPHPKRIATGGCDNLIRIWKEENGNWVEEVKLEGHTDWVRDVAWAPNVGMTTNTIASCGQDKQVFIHTQSPNGPWTKRPLRSDSFPDVLWRVSWSPSGNILAVSCGDNKVSLWKETIDGEWAIVGDVVEGAGAGQTGGY